MLHRAIDCSLLCLLDSDGRLWQRSSQVRCRQRSRHLPRQTAGRGNRDIHAREIPPGFRASPTPRAASPCRHSRRATEWCWGITSFASPRRSLTRRSREKSPYPKTISLLADRYGTPVEIAFESHGHCRRPERFQLRPDRLMRTATVEGIKGAGSVLPQPDRVGGKFLNQQAGMWEKRPSVKGGKGRYVFIGTNHSAKRTANRKQGFPPLSSNSCRSIPTFFAAPSPTNRLSATETN